MDGFNAKKPFSKDNLILVLLGLVIYLTTNFVGDVRASMATTNLNETAIKTHEVRFAGYDGMTQQVVAILIKLGGMEATLKRLENRQCLRTGKENP